MESKINKLKLGIIEAHSNEFRFKLDEVISMGESPIEKMMLLKLFNYFQKYGKVGDGNSDEIECHFTDIEFIEEEICLWDPDLSITEFKKNILEDKISRYNYRNKNGMFYKYVGFKCFINISELNTNIFREVEIRPQFYEMEDQNTYRIDIAFILIRKDWFSKKIVNTKKIALECDGYDYHSSPSKKREDDIRTRQLKRNGWKEVLRYSGSEIFRTSDNLEQTHYQFEEIMDIILL